MPAEMPPGFALTAILEREDPRDAFVCASHADLASLPAGARVGTASLRREAQIRHRFPALQVASLRGNLDTRLGRLDRGEYDAIILAAAGLNRLGLAQRVRALIALEDSLPAVGQGALAIEISAARDDLAQWLAPLNDGPSATCVRAERAASLSLGGSCQMPLAVHAVLQSGRLRVDGLVASADGRQLVRARSEGDADQPEVVGHALAEALREHGAAAILATLAI